MAPECRSGSRPTTSLYELVPTDPLPTVDLSLSLKSRFLGHSAFNRLNWILAKRFRGPISLAGVIAIIIYPIVLLAHKDVGKVLSIISTMMYMMTPIAGSNFLRIDIGWLLVATYDFWFFTFINTSTYTVLALLVGDIRAVAILVAWFGIQLNILVDANLRAVKAWVILTIGGIISHFIIWGAVGFEAIEDTHDFAVLRYKTHELPARELVCSGIVTIIALLARNVHRKRKIFQKGESGVWIECVSYRTDLKFATNQNEQANRISTYLTSPCQPHLPENIQKMRYIKQAGLTNGHSTLLKVKIRSWHCFALPKLGCTTLLAFVASYIYQRKLHGQKHQVPAIQLIVLMLTLAFCGMYFAQCQRDLL
uniref:Uncharacterized protein n=1 Tax=Globisporangium ultimum (strain ATCC 200006 / CBS 805.95 / DAOM BR144) TaxID=431595 RepID=K3WU21_GLOUD